MQGKERKKERQMIAKNEHEWINRLTLNGEKTCLEGNAFQETWGKPCTSLSLLYISLYLPSVYFTLSLTNKTFSLSMSVCLSLSVFLHPRESLHRLMNTHAMCEVTIGWAYLQLEENIRELLRGWALNITMIGGKEKRYSWFWSFSGEEKKREEQIDWQNTKKNREIRDQHRLKIDSLSSQVSESVCKSISVRVFRSHV